MLCPEYLRDLTNLWADALSRGKKAQQWSLGDPVWHRLFRWWGTAVVDLCVSRQTHRVPQYFRPGALRGDSIWGRCPEGEVAKVPWVCLPISKHHSTSPGQASKMGGGPDYDHTLLAREELVLRDHAPYCNRPTRGISSHFCGPYGMQQLGMLVPEVITRSNQLTT